MKSKSIIAIVAAIALPHFSFGEEDEEDKPVKFEELPVAVSIAIKGAAGEARLETIVLGDEDGTPAFEAIRQANSHKHEIALAKHGTVLGLEEIITLAETPDAMKAAEKKDKGENDDEEDDDGDVKGKP